jgi:hypothetical protein
MQLRTTFWSVANITTSIEIITQIEKRFWCLKQCFKHKLLKELEKEKEYPTLILVNWRA